MCFRLDNAMTSRESESTRWEPKDFRVETLQEKADRLTFISQGLVIKPVIVEDFEYSDDTHFEHFGGWAIMQKDVKVNVTNGTNYTHSYYFNGPNSDSSGVVIGEDGVLKAAVGKLEEQKKIYQRGLNLLKQHGLELPKPYLKFAQTENTIERELSNPENIIELDELKEKDLILTWGNYGPFYEGNTTIYVGTLKDILISRHTSKKNSGSTNWTIVLRPVWQIYYEQFAPGEALHIDSICMDDRLTKISFSKNDNRRKFDEGKVKSNVELDLKLPPIRRIREELLNELQQYK